MGACCNGKMTKHDCREEEIYTKSTRNQMLTEFKISNIPKIELEVEASNLNQKLRKIIKKYSNNFDYLNIKKFCLEQLWNVCKYYLDDFTNSEYILNDLRPKNQKTENFLKKFKIINYSVEEMKLLNESSMTKFKRFLDFKNLIIISNEELINTAEDLIDFLISRKINTKIQLFDHNLNEKELTPNNKYLYEILDTKNFRDFPFIMLSLKFFPHLKSENFIFLDYLKYDFPNKFTKQFLSDMINIDSNTTRFFLNYNVSTIVTLNSVHENDEFKLKSHNCKIIKMDIKSLNDLEIQKEEILQQFDVIKFEIISNKSVMLQIQDTTDIEILNYFIFLFIWKMTDIPPKKIKNYVMENFIFIKNIKNFCNSNFNRLDDFLKENYSISGEDDLFEIKREATDIDDLKLIREKFDYYLKRLKSEVPENTYIQIVAICEKIASNIIENPGNEKFYKIKIESQHFQNFIAINPNSLKLLELFGFSKKLFDESEYYCLNIDTNISFMKGLYFDFSNSVKSLA